VQVLTSIQLPDLKGEILLIASTQVLQQSGCSSSIQANIPLLDAYFTGTGVHILLSASLLLLPLSKWYKSSTTVHLATQLLCCILHCRGPYDSAAVGKLV